MGINFDDLLLDDAAPKRRKRIGRTKGDFYMVPEAWLERALLYLRGAAQVGVALRLYRRWLWARKRGANFVVASNETLLTSDGGGARRTKRDALRGLAAAGLIRVLSQGAKKASPRVQIIEVEE